MIVRRRENKNNKNIRDFSTLFSPIYFVRSVEFLLLLRSIFKNIYWTTFFYVAINKWAQHMYNEWKSVTMAATAASTATSANTEHNYLAADCTITEFQVKIFMQNWLNSIAIQIKFFLFACHFKWNLIVNFHWITIQITFWGYSTSIFFSLIEWNNNTEINIKFI